MALVRIVDDVDSNRSSYRSIHRTVDVVDDDVRNDRRSRVVVDGMDDEDGYAVVVVVGMVRWNNGGRMEAEEKVS
jgi:hypothetical protein